MPGASYTPGLPFLLGWQDRQFARTAGERGWITTDPLLNMPFQFTRNERISVRADVEPLPDLRIDVNADRSISKNLSEFYNYDPLESSFNADNLSERGNFSMSVLTWGTAFFAIGKEEVHQSEAFQKMKDYRLIIARRLASQRPANFGYDPGAVNPQTGIPGSIPGYRSIQSQPGHVPFPEIYQAKLEGTIRRDDFQNPQIEPGDENFEFHPFLPLELHRGFIPHQPELYRPG
jgi:cell surface protein SprA